MLIRSWKDAETVAAAYLRRLGYADARVTPDGVDGGVDVVCSAVIAQVKAEMNPTGAPVVQQTFGIASAHGKAAAVFSLAGFTNAARRFARDADVALFSFDLQSEVTCENESARRLGDASFVAKLSDRFGPIGAIRSGPGVLSRPVPALPAQIDAPAGPLRAVASPPVEGTVDHVFAGGRRAVSADDALVAELNLPDADSLMHMGGSTFRVEPRRDGDLDWFCELGPLVGPMMIGATSVMVPGGYLPGEGEIDWDAFNPPEDVLETAITDLWLLDADGAPVWWRRDFGCQYFGPLDVISGTARVETYSMMDDLTEPMGPAVLDISTGEVLWRPRPARPDLGGVAGPERGVVCVAVGPTRVEVCDARTGDVLAGCAMPGPVGTGFRACWVGDRLWITAAMNNRRGMAVVDLEAGTSRWVDCGGTSPRQWTFSTGWGASALIVVGDELWRYASDGTALGHVPVVGLPDPAELAEVRPEGATVILTAWVGTKPEVVFERFELVAM